MKQIQIKGLEKACSQIVLGSMVFRPDQMDIANEILDTYVEMGGNTIDTAHVYGGGQSEKAVGQWFKTRRNRKDIILIDKGAHPDAQGSRVNPEAIAQDLHESLDRLQEDYIDLYMLHRDDPAIPVGEIMDALHEQVQTGFIKAIGVSNWTHQRIEEANRYAAAKGIQEIVANSPNLSLAKPNEPRWAGCVSMTAEGIEWHKQSQLPLFSWSSQAGGFFTGRFSPERKDDPEMVRVYYNDENWERYRRAEQLAKEKGITPIQIALAYVLHQPFPTCALIGPQKVEELISSMKGTEIQLSSEEVSWLDLED